MRILFASTPGAGHVGPLLPFARAARAAGHEVLLAAAGPAAQRTGLPVLTLPEAPGRARAWAPVFTADAPGVVHVVQELFIGLDAAAALPGMLAAVEAFAPDVIVRETCEFASAVAAERFGVPVVQVGVHLDTATDTSEALLAVAEPAVRSLGLRDPARLLESPVLTLVPPSLSAPSPRLRHFRTAVPPPRERDLVYVSLGSETPRTPHFPRLYRAVIDALSTVDLEVLVALGRDPDDLGPVPANVRVARWVDQATTLSRAAVAVGHGGSGTTLGALAAGVPLALLPLFVDGPDNARRVAAAGAGLVVPDVAELANAMRRLLEDPRPRAAADAIAREIAALPPASAWWIGSPAAA
ncbi:MGT family glycosyltransferase [Solirubrobacter pauli]|uniref:MGT family glycosyltransferase n=1 Tax=Solirubrobacter pauli TaxID=166793 RepID=A0A660L9U1_9ACTN|nr:glycosyltransferase [Solirubrobacter pauli]RKQ90710.1 MGT family glycosyltransferase [Solirubrobacter pauli]